MGKYSSVDYATLRSAINTALSELDSHSLSNIRDNLNNSNVMSSSVKNVIYEKIGNIINSSNNGSINNLRDHLNKLNSAMWKIETIKSNEGLIYAYSYYKYYRDENNVIKPYYQGEIWRLRRENGGLETEIYNLLT